MNTVLAVNAKLNARAAGMDKGKSKKTEKLLKKYMYSIYFHL
jgi:hypothetical protein